MSFSDLSKKAHHADTPAQAEARAAAVADVKAKSDAKAAAAATKRAGEKQAGAKTDEPAKK
jgi:hypothetical protein